MSALTRGGMPSPGRLYEVSQDRSPSSTSTWKRSSNAWRSRKPASKALRSAPITSRKTWSSICVRRVASAGVENVWLERRVLNYAHQGGAAEAPSSTLFALDQAVAAGADALELDVHATADGELVVCHDATVDATTDGAGAIAELTLAEVSRLDNAYRFGQPEFPYRGRGFGVATLRSVLEQFPSIFLN